MFANFNMNSNATFIITHFLKLCNNVFILENKIDALEFRKICFKMCYNTLEITLVCVNIERVSFYWKEGGTHRRSAWPRMGRCIQEAHTAKGGTDTKVGVHCKKETHTRMEGGAHN
jgi:hypothetical protein